MKNENQKSKNAKAGEAIAEGIGHKVDYAVKENANIGKEQIREWLVKDIRGVYILLAEILNSKEATDALVEVFWNRYKTMHEAKQNQTELNLKKND